MYLVLFKDQANKKCMIEREFEKILLLVRAGFLNLRIPENNCSALNFGKKGRNFMARLRLAYP